jgi:Fic family protein
VVLPRHEHRVVPWRQQVRGGTAADRTLAKVTVSLPPQIGELSLGIPGELGARMELAVREIAALDEEHGASLGSLSTLLLRAESVASSKIERVEATVDDFARALHGSRASSSAASMVASARALHDLIEAVAGGRPITLDSLLRAHRTLMADDASERAYAGRVRDMQNWIGGSNHSPRGALYVPPPPGTLAGYLGDLTHFANRDDLNVLAQAAVAHAQFESIHPFTDGNGRIGRALINAILRRRGTTHRVVVPLASALVAKREEYFATLTDYRSGDAGPIIEAFSAAALAAAAESRTTAQRLRELPMTWRERAGRPRAGSAPTKLLETLLDEPVFSAEEAAARVGGATSSVYAAISRLHEADIIRPLTQRTRNQVWVAADLADELDDLGGRIAARARLAR